MRKLFGEYLVEKGLVSAEQLLAALVEQIHSMPALVDIIYRRKLLSPLELLAALKYQTVHRAEFRSACEALSLWGPKLAEAIEEELLRASRPIGEILVKRGSLGLEALIVALADYNACAGDLDSQPKADSRSVSPRARLSAGLNIPLIPLFAAQCDQARVARLKARALDWRRNSDQRSIEEVVREIRILRGLATILCAPQTAKLLAEIEAAAAGAMRMSRGAVADPGPDFMPLFERAVAELVALRRSILESKTEGAGGSDILADLIAFNAGNALLGKTSAIEGKAPLA
jgi:hypothetical protein